MEPQAQAKRNKTRKATRDPPPALKIALCIPFDFGDFPFLLQCLQSVQTQTRQPDILVISFSRCNATVKEKLIELIEMTPPFLGSTCLLFAEEKQLAGENRNAAAAVAKEHGAQILSFFDGDDIAHPRRLELIEQAFLRHPEVLSVLHSYRPMTKEPVRHVADLEWPPIKGALYRNCFRITKIKERPARLYVRDALVKLDPAAEHIQNGHISVRLEAWEKSPYNERLPIGEDSYFNAALYDKFGGGTMALLSDPLCYYLNGAPPPRAQPPRPAAEESSEPSE